MEPVSRDRFAVALPHVPNLPTIPVVYTPKQVAVDDFALALDRNFADDVLACRRDTCSLTTLANANASDNRLVSTGWGTVSLMANLLDSGENVQAPARCSPMPPAHFIHFGQMEVRCRNVNTRRPGLSRGEPLCSDAQTDVSPNVRMTASAAAI